tara:strand:- start:293 stop:1084 length:792 start_codon:yes stop_codon:yes gene_type:complete
MSKILILLDGSEEYEKSIDYLLNSKIINFDELILCFILEPMHQVKRISNNQVLFTDSTYEKSDILSKIYLEKIINVINNVDAEIKVSVNTIDSIESIKKIQSIDQISLSLISHTYDKLYKLFFSANKFKSYINNLHPLLSIPPNSKHDDSKTNNFMINFPNEEIFMKIIDNVLMFKNLNRMTIIYKRNKIEETSTLIDKLDSFNIPFEFKEIKDSYFEEMNRLQLNNNVIFYYYSENNFIENKYIFKDSIQKFIIGTSPVILG